MAALTTTLMTTSSSKHFKLETWPKVSAEATAALPPTYSPTTTTRKKLTKRYFYTQATGAEATAFKAESVRAESGDPQCCGPRDWRESDCGGDGDGDYDGDGDGDGQRIVKLLRFLVTSSQLV